MIKEALQELAEFVVASVDASVRVIRDEGGQYVLERKGAGVDAMRQLIPADPKAAKAIEVHTLDAVTDYLRENRDGLALAKVVIHVGGPRMVRVLGPLREHRDRECFVIATPPADDLAGLNTFQPQADFLLMLQRFFVADAERAALLLLAGTLADEDARTAVDDGVTQIVATKAGSRLGSAAVKNPWLLVPRRSFPEVALAPVPFVLRVKGNGPGQPSSLALFEADGGAWRVDAIAKIRAHLTGAAGAVWGIVA